MIGAVLRPIVAVLRARIEAEVGAMLVTVLARVGRVARRRGRTRMVIGGSPRLPAPLDGGMVGTRPITQSIVVGGTLGHSGSGVAGAGAPARREPHDSTAW